MNRFERWFNTLGNARAVKNRYLDIKKLVSAGFSRNKHRMSVPTTHPFDFDPTYGMQREQLLAITPPEAPPGFDDFWKKRYRRALATDPRPVLRKSRLSHPRWHVLDITYTSTGGFRIGGWMLLPREGRCVAASSSATVMAGAESPISMCQWKKLPCCFPAFAAFPERLSADFVRSRPSCPLQHRQERRLYHRRLCR